MQDEAVSFTLVNVALGYPQALNIPPFHLSLLQVFRFRR